MQIVRLMATVSPIHGGDHFRNIGFSFFFHGFLASLPSLFGLLNVDKEFAICLRRIPNDGVIPKPPNHPFHQTLDFNPEMSFGFMRPNHEIGHQLFKAWVHILFWQRHEGDFNKPNRRTSNLTTL